MPIPGEQTTPEQLRLLATLLATPADDALAALHELATGDLELQEACAELTPLPLDRWQGEHTRLFVSAFPKVPCPPFESAYRHGQMDGKATLELETLYRRIGLESKEIPADYLGVILECAAWLMEQPEETAAGYLNELWQQHLALWLPQFSADLQRESELRLYRLLGERLGSLVPATAETATPNPEPDVH
jgi:TorA maturation chaperone TorD